MSYLDAIAALRLVLYSLSGENQMLAKPPGRKAPNPIDKHVGSRVCMRRKMLGISQTALGRKLGLTFQQVQKYEKGTNRISASRLQRLSQVFQVPVSFFFEDPLRPGEASNETRTSASDELMQFLTTTDGLRLAKTFSKIPDPQIRRNIVRLVRDIASEGLE